MSPRPTGRSPRWSSGSSREARPPSLAVQKRRQATIAAQAARREAARQHGIAAQKASKTTAVDGDDEAAASKKNFQRDPYEEFKAEQAAEKRRIAARPNVTFVGYQHNVFSVAVREGVAQIELRDLRGGLIEVQELAGDGQFRMKQAPKVVRVRVWVDGGAVETYTLARGETQEPFAQRLHQEIEERAEEERRAVYAREFDK